METAAFCSHANIRPQTAKSNAMNQYENIGIEIHDTRTAMGAAAAKAVADTINHLLKDQATVNIIFAAAPSQNEFLAALCSQPVDWQRINAFHMDEYIGLDNNSAQSFAGYLKKKPIRKSAGCHDPLPGWQHVGPGCRMQTIY
jgi:hypothetical protein